MRVETGGYTFPDDWTGYFIRGDDCIILYNDLLIVIEELDHISEYNCRFIKMNLIYHARKIALEVLSKKEEDLPTILNGSFESS